MNFLIVALLVVGAGAAIAATIGRSGKARVELLVRRCRGDRAQAERLIQYEQKRAPRLSRGEAALRAMSSLRRDNS